MRVSVSAITGKYSKKKGLLLGCVRSKGPQSIDKSVIIFRRARFYVQVDAIGDIRTLEGRIKGEFNMHPSRTASPNGLISPSVDC